MVRGILIILGLGLTGLLLFLGSGPLGELRPGMVGDRACSRLANHTPVAPNPVAEAEVGRQEPPAQVAGAGIERQESWRDLVGHWSEKEPVSRPGYRPRLPTW